MINLLTDNLLSKQKWALAAGIVCIYLPIRIFVSNPEFNVPVVANKAPLWLMEFLVNLLFFRIWIGIIELIHLFLDWLKTSFSIRLPQTFFTYLTGLLLAVLFNVFFVLIWIKAETFFREQFQVNIQRSQFEKTPEARRQKSKANTGLTVMAMLATIYMVSVKRSDKRLEQAQLKAERLELENLQTRFLALKSQLSPHFLFNSLSILTSLIEKNPQQSVKYVNRLSKTYRYILEHAEHETVTLQTELDFIEAYIFLLKSRFEDKLEVSMNISQEGRMRSRIAPLTLQLLIENAVKHNRMSQEEPLCITIETADNDLIVRNPIHQRNGLTGSTEIGLKNIVRRYGLLTKDPVSVSREAAIFTVKIPLLT